jgi:signal recognition particle GTPase
LIRIFDELRPPFAADLWVRTSTQLIEGVQQGLKRGDLQDRRVREFIKEEILRILKSAEQPLRQPCSNQTLALMVMGVGGKDDHHRENCITIPPRKKVLIGAAIRFGPLR